MVGWLVVGRQFWTIGNSPRRTEMGHWGPGRCTKDYKRERDNDGFSSDANR